MSHRYIAETVRARLRAQARERCGYCLSVQQYVLGRLEIDHLIPRARGGTDTVLALQLNHVMAVLVRRAWVAAGWHPPLD
ncbi:MAG: hypothetical protein HOP18_10185 [Deltaproteobacteria bacterium]|nr:hypothetical protein [Deltaproteobacteria bacterium]